MSSDADSLCEIRENARAIFGRLFSGFCQDDALVVEERHWGMRVEFVSSRTSLDPGDVTCIELCFPATAGEMWIASLRVATPLRLTGLGRQLVEVAETVARELGVPTVHVYPFLSARSFWERMQYRSHRYTARVLSKDLTVEWRSGGLPCLQTSTPNNEQQYSPI